MAMIIAVLERHAALPLGANDIFASVVGGIQAVEPAMDLSVAMAIASSVREKPLPADCVFAAELGLGGELRGVTMAESRLKEAEKLGFKQAVLAPSSATNTTPRGKIKARAFRSIAEVLDAFC